MEEKIFRCFFVFYLPLQGDSLIFGSRDSCELRKTMSHCCHNNLRLHLPDMNAFILIDYEL